MAFKNNTTLITEGVKTEGKLDFPDSVQIDGEVFNLILLKKNVIKDLCLMKKMYNTL